jgi:hypothetical protein
MNNSELALDDILHLNSPSQSLKHDLDIPKRTKSTSPEPLPDSDIVQIRRKVIEMYKSDPSLSPRENELTDMVRILISRYPHMFECSSVGTKAYRSG